MVKFYDVKARKSFETNRYETRIKTVNGKKRKFAVAKSPLTGIMCWRVL